jgi:hypothetical protein
MFNYKTTPGFPRSCFKCRRSKFDDDEFINEIVKDNERRRIAVPLDPEATYHVKQPEPVMQMGTQYPPRRHPSDQMQQEINKPQPELPRGGSSLERGGRHEET